MSAWSAVVGLGLLLLKSRGLRRSGEEDSKREEMPEGALPRGDWAELWGQALNAPYAWGGGRVGECWPGGPFDCSGFVDCALRAAGAELPWERAWASSATIANMLGVQPLEPGEEAPLGAIVVYGSGSPSHVMLSLGEDGVIGASGGDRSTNADDPNAKVKTFSSAWYRSDVLGWSDPW